MKIDVRNYKISGRVFFGDNLRLIFENKTAKESYRVLELKSVAGFFDHLSPTYDLVWIRFDEPGGVYNLDLSMRLQKPELENNREVFIFTDDNCVNFCFRCSASNAVFRDWTDKDKWLR
jgi:hypothetical protein